MAGGASQPGQFFLDARHEVTAVGQLGEEVGGGQRLQLRLDAFVFGDVGDEAVPEHAAVSQALGVCVALAPAGVAAGDQHPVLHVPGVRATAEVSRESW